MIWDYVLAVYVVFMVVMTSRVIHFANQIGQEV